MSLYPLIDSIEPGFRLCAPFVVCVPAPRQWLGSYEHSSLVFAGLLGLFRAKVEGLAIKVGA